jgi:CubicO group peptidase (beta-lactamase class C family)
MIFSTSAMAVAQTSPPPPLDALASDPVKLGWMVGSPPPPEKLIRFADGSFRKFPQTRWTYSNLRQFVPTRVISRGNATPSPLLRAERSDIDTVECLPIGGSKPMTWAQSLLANYTDGILVLHRGGIVYERYFGVLTLERQHIAFSVTKSFVATLAATLIAEGVLSESASVASFVPELRDSGFGSATLPQLLDMTTGIKFDEDYAKEKAEIWEFNRAANLLPRPPGYAGPDSYYSYLPSIQSEVPHGQRFAYRTPNTSVLAWVMHRATGKEFGELLRERIWSKLGAEQDAYCLVDTAGTDNAGGGLNLTLRDMARFGEMIRLDGRGNGQQIVPKSVIDDIRQGGNREFFAKAGHATKPGWSYRGMWWVSHNEHGAFDAQGIHGQVIYIDPTAEMVIARFASHPQASSTYSDPTSLPAYHAVAKHLMATAR